MRNFWMLIVKIAAHQHLLCGSCFHPEELITFVLPERLSAWRRIIELPELQFVFFDVAVSILLPVGTLRQ